MAVQRRRRRGTTAQHVAFTGALAELTVDTDEKVVVAHDGSTAGGFRHAREDRTLRTYPTRAAHAAATIPAGVNNVQLVGFAAAGDGGAHRLKRVTSEPSHGGKARSTDRVLPNGTTSAENGGWWELDEPEWRPEMLGAPVNGTDDDATAVQAAITGFRAVKFTAGKTYKINSQITISADDTVIDLRGAIIDASDFVAPETTSGLADGVFHVLGTERLFTTLAASPATDDVTLTLTSVTGVSPGDCLYMIPVGTTTQIWYTEQASAVRRSNVSKIISVDADNDQVTIQDPLQFGFDISAGAVNVSIWRGVRNVTFLGGRIVGPGFVENRQNGVGEAGITTRFAQNVVVDGTSVEDMQGAIGWFQRTHGATWRGGQHIGRPLDYDAALVESENMGFTGIWAFESAAVSLTGLRGSRLRHLVDGARACGVIVSDCHAFDCHRPPYTTHTGCTDWTFQNCYYRGPEGGILWRGWSCKVIGGNIDCPNDAEPCFYDTSGASADLGRTVQIIGLRGSAGRECVKLNGNIKYALIDSCDFVGARETGYAVVEVETLDSEHVEIRGGRFETLSGGDVISWQNNTPRTRKTCVVKDARLEGYSTAGSGMAVRFYSGASTTIDHAVVKGCTFEPSGSFTAEPVFTDGTFGVVESGPNYDRGIPSWPVDSITVVISDGTNDAVVNPADTIAVRRQGDLIHLSGRVRVTDMTGVTGNLRMELPWTLAGNCGGEIHAGSGLNLASAGQRLSLRGLATQDYLTFLVWSSTAGTAAVGASVFTGTTDIHFSATLVV